MAPDTSLGVESVSTAGGCGATPGGCIRSQEVEWALDDEGGTAIAGAASAVFTATGDANTSATVEQSEAFLVAYGPAGGRPWTEEELELAWTAGLWVRVFNANKATLRPGGETPSPSPLRLEAEVGVHLRYAGA
jgi:hypothetical protein